MGGVFGASKPDKEDKPTFAIEKSDKKVELVENEKEYIANYLELYSVNAWMQNDILEGKIPGVSFKIKNKGNKVLDEVIVTFYFKDGEGKRIAEQQYQPITTAVVYGRNHGP